MYTLFYKPVQTSDMFDNLWRNARGNTSNHQTTNAYNETRDWRQKKTYACEKKQYTSFPWVPLKTCYLPGKLRKRIHFYTIDEIPAIFTNLEPCAWPNLAHTHKPLRDETCVRFLLLTNCTPTLRAWLHEPGCIGVPRTELARLSCNREVDFYCV